MGQREATHLRPARRSIAHRGHRFWGGLVRGLCGRLLAGRSLKPHEAPWNPWSNRPSQGPSPAQHRVHPPRHLLLALLQHVAVGVRRQHDRRVPERRFFTSSSLCPARARTWPRNDEGRGTGPAVVRPESSAAWNARSSSPREAASRASSRTRDQSRPSVSLPPTGPSSGASDGPVGPQ